MTDPLERVEEIVARCETFQYSLPRDEQRALITSWRERGEALERAQQGQAMSERLPTEHLRLEYRDDPDLLALMDEHDALRARVAKLEEALRDARSYIQSVMKLVHRQRAQEALAAIDAALKDKP